MIPSANQFKLSDARSYDHVTRSFDHYTERVSRPLADYLVSLARISPSQLVIDIGTGTGVVALQAAQAVGPSGQVLGIDLSPRMLATARAKAEQRRILDRLSFQEMDAESLAIDAESVDTVLSLFALLHFPNPNVALAEMYRVLRPGGTLVIGVGSSPPLTSIRGWFNRLGRLAEVPRIAAGRFLVGPGFLDALVAKHLPPLEVPAESPLAAARKNRSRAVPGLLRRAGFRRVRTGWRGHQLIVKTSGEFWEIQRTFSTVARKRLLAAPPDLVRLVRDEFDEKCDRVRARGGTFAYPHAMVYATAVRPR